MRNLAVGLSIDTSGSVGSVAVDDLEPVRAKRFSEGLVHGKALLPSVELILKEARLKKPDYIAVGLGPGSYTGLRIGVTVARTLAWTWEVPLLGICSMTGVAYGAGPRRCPVAIVLDAHQKEVYWACYRWEDGLPRLIAGPSIDLPEDARTELPKDAFFVGDGCAKLGVAPGIDALVPQASWVLKLARIRFLRGERDRIQTVLPMYLRVSEAERKLEARS